MFYFSTVQPDTCAFLANLFILQSFMPRASSCTPVLGLSIHLSVNNFREISGVNIHCKV
uniref:Uncharacterized protein n=1 Tax=Arundo donax TaxID=35708 RepID=A0A0A8ZTC2_ARUDO